MFELDPSAVNGTADSSHARRQTKAIRRDLPRSMARSSVLGSWGAEAAISVALHRERAVGQVVVVRLSLALWLPAPAPRFVNM